MICLIAAVVASSMAMAQSSTPAPSPSMSSIPAPAVAAPSKELPPPPPGPSTVMGGEIRKVNPVLDQITLRVFGSDKKIKILFDERTQVYTNGKRISVLDLAPNDHASIETTLDGSKIFALRIHMLSKLPQGECQGQVLRFDPRSGELTVNAALSSQSIRLRVPPSTPIERVGQKEFAGTPGGVTDLEHGSLVDVQFEPSQSGRGVATHIDVLATPGSSFSFRGNISVLDFHSGLMVITDPADNETYRLHFDARLFPDIRNMHEGSRVAVTANYDGSQYLVSQITME